MAWTDERVEELKQLWAEGLSASQIANRIGGVTRNAVIGKVHRLGLSGRATPAAPSRGRHIELAKPAREPSEVTVQRAERPYTETVGEGPVVEPAMLSGGEPATVSTLSRNMCKWPIGDPAMEDFHFCGQPASAGKPYCAHHCEVAFQPAQRRSDRQTDRARPAVRRIAG